jgi:hypothetical protein
MPKYNTSKKFINNFTSYKGILSKRGLKQAEYLESPVFLYPDSEDMKNLNISYEIWESDSRMYKLSKKYYNDESYGWIILFFNKLGSEYDLKPGMMIAIPQPLETFLEIIGQ